MKLKYIYFAFIPVLFGVGSCSGEERKIETAMNFSTDHPIRSDIIEQAATPPGKKPVKAAKPAENTDSTKSAEPAPTEVKAEPTAVKPTKVSKLNDGLEGLKRFNIGYLTFNVADFFAEIRPVDEKPDHTEYMFRLYSRTNTFVDYLFGWTSYGVSYLKLYDNKVVPESFQSKIVLKKKVREIALNYDDKGDITSESVLPPDNRGKRPAVPEAQKDNTYDPLSVVIETRRIVMKAVKENNFNERGKYSFTLPIYDGRRRSDLNFELDKKKISDLYHLKVIQVAVSGYTKSEMQDANKGERSVDIFIDPSNFWPVSATGRSAVGSARAKYIGNCTQEFKDCIKQQ